MSAATARLTRARRGRGRRAGSADPRRAAIRHATKAAVAIEPDARRARRRTAAAPSRRRRRTATAARGSRTATRPAMTIANPATGGRSDGSGRDGAGIGAMVGPTARRGRSRRPVSSARAPASAGRRPSRMPRPAAPRRPARAGPAASRIEVNGIRISRKTSIETRKPANRNRTPRNLPSWNTRSSRTG